MGDKCFHIRAVWCNSSRDGSYNEAETSLGQALGQSGRAKKVSEQWNREQEKNGDMGRAYKILFKYRKTPASWKTVSKGAM